MSWSLARHADSMGWCEISSLSSPSIWSLQHRNRIRQSPPKSCTWTHRSLILTRFFLDSSAPLTAPHGSLCTLPLPLGRLCRRHAALDPLPGTSPGARCVVVAFLAETAGMFPISTSPASIRRRTLSSGVELRTASLSRYGCRLVIFLLFLVYDLFPLILLIILDFTPGSPFGGTLASFRPRVLFPAPSLIHRRVFRSRVDQRPPLIRFFIIRFLDTHIREVEWARKVF